MVVVLLLVVGVMEMTIAVGGGWRGASPGHGRGLRSPPPTNATAMTAATAGVEEIGMVVVVKKGCGNLLFLPLFVVGRGWWWELACAVRGAPCGPSAVIWRRRLGAWATPKAYFVIVKA